MKASIQIFKRALPFYSNYNGGSMDNISRPLHSVEDLSKIPIYIDKKFILNDKNNKKWIYRCVFIGSEQDSLKKIELFKFKDNEGNVYEIKSNSISWNVYVFSGFGIFDYVTDLFKIGDFRLNDDGTIDYTKKVV
jgi:hypothetical protein